MIKTVFSCLVLSLFFLACKKNVEGLTFPADARVNFFHAAHPVIPYIMIDSLAKELPTNVGISNTQPGFFGLETFPRNMPGSGEIAQGGIVYMAVKAGRHQFFFTDSSNTIRAAKTVDMPAGKHFNLYLTDSLLQYDVLVIPADPVQTQSGKVSIQLLNLVPDLILNTKMVKIDGTQTNTGIPQQIGWYYQHIIL